MNEIKIVLADAQPVFRVGMRKLLEKQPGLTIAAEAGNTGELLPALLTHHPDILILDINPQYFDINKLSEILTEKIFCKVIILSSQQQEWNTFRTLAFNVYCYLTKECGIHDIIKAIGSASRGEKFFCSYIVNILMREKLSETDDHTGHIPTCLTEREKEITKLVSEGKVNKQIAAMLNLSPHTIHTHRKNIMKKLGLHSAVELSNYAKQTGILI